MPGGKVVPHSVPAGLFPRWCQTPGLAVRTNHHRELRNKLIHPQLPYPVVSTIVLCNFFLDPEHLDRLLSSRSNLSHCLPTWWLLGYPSLPHASSAQRCSLNWHVCGSCHSFRWLVLTPWGSIQDHWIPWSFSHCVSLFLFWGKGFLGASIVNGWLVGRVRENWPWWVTAEAGYWVIKSPRKMQFRRYRKMLEKHLQRRTWNVTLKSKYKYPILLGPARPWTLQKPRGTQGTGMGTAWSS